VTGSIALTEGGEIPIDRTVLLAPLEQALRALSWGIVLLGAALAVSRMH
jgi:hypothetical protein